MTVLHNEILIDAPMEKIWAALTNVEELGKFDPTVKESLAQSSHHSGLGAKRKVNMADGKNWFEEQCIDFKPHEALTYELSACSFPIHNLKHAYSFEKVGTHIKVKQIMTYQMKFGVIGKLLDFLMVRKQTTGGIQKFFSGLKQYAEKQ